ncbi:MAG: ankyrin repeat domain-containing protein [Flavobacteriales bacterium]
MRAIFFPLLLVFLGCSNQVEKSDNGNDIEDRKKPIQKRQISIPPQAETEKQQWYQYYISTAIKNNDLDSLIILNPDTSKLSKRFIHQLNGIFKQIEVERKCDSLTVQYLLEKGVLKFAHKQDSAYSFLLAVQYHNLNLIHYWLDNSNLAKMELSLSESGDDLYNISPFGKALEMNDFELVELFQEHVIITPDDLKYTETESTRFVLESLRKRHFQIDSISTESLHDAIFFGKVEKVKVLAEYGANLKSSYRGTPLFHLCVQSHGFPLGEWLSERLEIASFMLENGVDVMSENNQGETVAHIILGGYSDDGPGYEEYQKDRINFLKLFSRYDIDLDKKNKNGKSFYDLLEASPHHLVKKHIESELKE